MPVPRRSKLWLADTLWKLGAIQRGDFTLGRSTIHSPIYVNLRLLVGHPQALSRIARLLLMEVRALQQMRHPRIEPFDVVAGIPFGGLHIATAFSLATRMPLVYPHPRPDDFGHDIEGIWAPNQSVLIIDDLMAGGGSIVQLAQDLRERGLIVRDAIVLVDREQGGAEELRREGITLTAILNLTSLLTHLVANHRMPEEWYRESTRFLESFPREKRLPDGDGQD